MELTENRGADFVLECSASEKGCSTPSTAPENRRRAGKRNDFHDQPFLGQTDFREYGRIVPVSIQHERLLELEWKRKPGGGRWT